jgi:MFS family permease
VGAALVVDTAAYATITPLLPSLTSEHDLGKAGAGMLAASYPAGVLLLGIPAAALATRVGAKRATIGALLGLALSSLAFGLASSALALGVARFAQGVGASVLWAGALAWLIAETPRERRAEAIGSAVGAAIAGALLGPVLGAAAEELGRIVVFGAFVIVPLALTVWALRMPASGARVPITMREIRTVFGDARMRSGVWLMALPAIAFGTLGVLVPLRLDELGSGAIVVGATFLGAGLFEAIIAPLSGRLADRRGSMLPARIGLGAGAVLLLVLAIPTGVPPIVLAVMVAAPLLGMLWSPGMTILSEAAEERGIDPAFGFGLANMAWGLGATIGGSGGGALASATADAVPYVLVASLCFATVAYFSGSRRAAGSRVRTAGS